MHSSIALTLALAMVAAAQDPWTQQFGSLEDLTYSGITTFAHLPHTLHGCLRNTSTRFDIALLGAPFDTTVSFRPGARFGPYGIRSGSRRQRPDRGYHPEVGINPYKSDLTILDCGDVPMSPYNPSLAIDQLQAAYTSLLNREPISEGARTIDGLAKDDADHPRIVTMGGDHTIVLPILRSLFPIYGPISVIHFDAHLDTWNPAANLGSGTAEDRLSRETHGTFFSVSADEGLLGPSIHVGIRTRLTDIGDYRHDEVVGFQLITTDMVDDLGIPGVIAAIHKRVAGFPVYVSLDIDVVDPAMAPATGTPESGGLLSREVKRIIRGLKGLNIVGVDLVEVSPPFDTNAELTGVLAADLIHEFLSTMVKGDAEYDATLVQAKAEKEGRAVKDEL